ncbi:hypothetical protein [Streptomyces sp. NPDC050704]|uniref:hypothetical protein n=1 Tax=Streptomyces sp. NPDC050704 TaxID=3157219 RepID=UPI00342CB7F3
MSENLPMHVDDLLVGHWSSAPFSYGVMETSELGLLADGRGWSSWFNSGALCVTRLSWICPEPGIVELRAQWIVEGTPGSEGVGSLTPASTQPAEPLDEVTRHHYAVGSAVPMPGGEAVMTLSFEEPVEFCHQYARGTKEIRAEDDPARLLLPYQ